jgi:hypothetical protein
MAFPFRLFGGSIEVEVSELRSSCLDSRQIIKFVKFTQNLHFWGENLQKLLEILTRLQHLFTKRPNR